MNYKSRTNTFIKKTDSCFEYQLNKVGFQHKYIQSSLSEITSIHKPRIAVK